MDDTDLAEETYRMLRQVPRGRVTTYGALARALGAIEASRLVGGYMARNPYAPEVPCHRVVHSDGSVGKFSAPGGTKRKVQMLKEEGVRVKGGKVLDFEKVFFNDLIGNGPLKALRDYQLSLLPRLILEDRREPYSNLMAIDVAYIDEGAFAAGASFDLRADRPGPTVTVHLGVDFPYIPTFLGFREIPAIKAVLGSLVARPDLLLVDGHGVMHPHGMGIASMAGIELDIPTIGVGKSILVGKVEDPPAKVGEFSEVLVDGAAKGFALRISETARGMVYVSPGHLVSPHRAVEIVRKLIIGGQVEPLRRAHLKATEAAASFKSGRPLHGTE